MKKERALKAINLEPTDRIPHWEWVSNPQFEKALTGIDPYQHPQRSGLRLLELLDIDVGSVPLNDKPIEKLPEDQLTSIDLKGRHVVRWGTGVTTHWDWGKRFTTVSEVLSYEPLKHLNLRKGEDVCENYDYSQTVEELSGEFGSQHRKAQSVAGERALVHGAFYNTLFMWPLLTFGWELFLEAAAGYPDEFRRVLNDFAEISAKALLAWSQTGIELFCSHDDICCARGPVFSPEWLRRHMYPHYERVWAPFRKNGIKVVFISDGDVGRVADDIFACGADGIIAEPCTNAREIARKHPDKIIVAGGDNRVLSRNNRDEIFAMVKEMSSWGKALPGYFFGVVNHIPWNIPVEAIFAYFEASGKFGPRT